MPAPKDTALSAAGSTIPVSEFTSQFRDDLIPLNNAFSYFFLASKPGDEELKEYLDEPVAALPPKILALLPRINLYFVPFLERNGKRTSPLLVSLVRPAQALPVSIGGKDDGPGDLVFPIEDRDVAEYHYRFYQSIATIVADAAKEFLDSHYLPLIRQELRANVHGESDEPSWEKKIALLERQSMFHGTNKALREYARQSLIDTLTLYLHGICCDLDVDTGPRQLASRHLRKRLEMLEAEYPPPTGYAVFPEELKS